MLRQQATTEESISNSSKVSADVKTSMADVKAECSQNNTSAAKQPAAYKRVIGAEEKIQEELREMLKREEELRSVVWSDA